MSTRRGLVPLTELLSAIVDNRGRTCPTSDTGIPLIATNCIRNDLLYPAHEKVRFVTADIYRSWFRGHPLPGDLLFVTKGTPGRVCMVPDTVDFCIAQDMVALRADEARIYPRYLFAVLRSSEVQANIESMHVGTLIPHFKKGDFDKLLLPLVDRPTQEFIGDLYFELSYKIELNRRMNVTLEAMARAIFQSWFVDFDPVCAKAEGRETGLPAEIAALFPDEFLESELGEIPKGWTVAPVGDDVQIVKGVSYRSEHLAPSGTAMVNLKSIQRGGGYRADGLKEFTGPYKPEQIVFPYELVVAQTDVTQAAEVIGKPAIVLPDERYRALVASLDILIIRPRAGDLARYFFYFMFGRPEYQDHIYGHTNGTTVLHLSRNGVPSFRYAKPPAQLAIVYGRTVAPLFDRQFRNSQEVQTLSAARDGLIPMLISGQLRIPEAEDMIEEANALL